MLRTLLAAAAAVALFAGTPALADGCKDCKNCPHHKVAAADDKGEKKDTAEKPAGCACGHGKDCKCGDACKCAHCAEHKAKKADEKKT